VNFLHQVRGVEFAETLSATTNNTFQITAVALGTFWQRLAQVAQLRE